MAYSSGVGHEGQISREMDTTETTYESSSDAAAAINTRVGCNHAERSFTAAARFVLLDVDS
jgi:hypothetical protein